MFQKISLIDLTHPLTKTSPTWKGSCGFSFENKIDYDQGLRAQSLRMHAGVGTHMDAPSHFISGGRDIHEIPLDELVIKAYRADFSKIAHHDFQISVGHLKDFEKEFGKIEKDTLFYAYTGWDQYWENPDVYRGVDQAGQMHFPTYTKEAAEFLLERGIVGIGIDTLSPDLEPKDDEPFFPVHRCILGAGRYIVENVANLGKVPPFFQTLCLPLKLDGVTESPVRAVAILEK